MQELWLQNIEWDEPLSQELSEKWLNIAEDIETVSGTLNFPRCPITNNPHPGHGTKMWIVYMNIFDILIHDITNIKSKTMVQKR
jgi:hypothetical protein